MGIMNEYFIRTASSLDNRKKEIANSFIRYTKHNGEVV